MAPSPLAGSLISRLNSHEEEAQYQLMINGDNLVVPIDGLFFRVYANFDK